MLCNSGQSVLVLHTDNTCRHLRQVEASAAETGARTGAGAVHLVLCGWALYSAS